MVFHCLHRSFEFKVVVLSDWLAAKARQPSWFSCLNHSWIPAYVRSEIKLSRPKFDMVQSMGFLQNHKNIPPTVTKQQLDFGNWVRPRNFQPAPTLIWRHSKIVRILLILTVTESQRALVKLWGIVGEP